MGSVRLGAGHNTRYKRACIQTGTPPKPHLEEAVAQGHHQRGAYAEQRGGTDGQAGQAEQGGGGKRDGGGVQENQEPAPAQRPGGGLVRGDAWGGGTGRGGAAGRGLCDSWAAGGEVGEHPTARVRWVVPAGTRGDGRS